MPPQFLTWSIPTSTSADHTQPFTKRAKHYIKNCKTFTHDGTQIFPTRKDIKYIFMAHDMFSKHVGSPAQVAVEKYELYPPNIN